MRKKIEIEILKDDDIGLKKGQKKKLDPPVAEKLIADKKAKKIREIIIPRRKDHAEKFMDLETRVQILEEEIENLKKKK